MWINSETVENYGEKEKPRRDSGVKIYLVGRKRLELLTSSTSRTRSSQLSYRPLGCMYFTVENVIFQVRSAYFA